MRSLQKFTAVHVTAHKLFRRNRLRQSWSVFECNRAGTLARRHPLGATRPLLTDRLSVVLLPDNCHQVLSGQNTGESVDPLSAEPIPPISP